jgi:hypothetical protein
MAPLSAMSSSDPKLFDGLGKNTADSFSGSNILFHLSAMASTPVLIGSGVDAHLHDTFCGGSGDAAWPGAVIGSGAGALATALWLYSPGDSPDNRESRGAAFVIAQASLITITYVTFLKSLTGRAHPTNSSALGSQEQSEQFEFGFKRLGIGYGWPSGHVSHTVAVTTALAYYYPQKQWLRWLSIGLSTYMLYTVTAFHSGQMHWFSDGVAGAFVGYAIGSSVGRNFRAQIDEGSVQASALDWIPVVSDNYCGLVATTRF